MKKGKLLSAKVATPRVAIVYDRVNTPYGGAERVLLALHELYPDAPLFTSVYDPQRAQWAQSFQVIPSFLQHIPFARIFHRLFVGFMPLAFESFYLGDYDIIISVTSAEAKGVLTLPHQLHICYLLTPTRYLWSHEGEYAHHWLTGWIRRRVFAYLKWWDTVAATRPDVLIPISKLVSERCQKFYQRTPEPVIYPPLSVQEFKKARSKPFQRDYYLIVARLVPYKRVDLAIRACQKLGRNLVIIGEGPDLDRLQNLSEKGNPTAKITFLQAVQPDEVVAYYSYCRAFLAPAEEDFGITALEAQAAGKPVVIFAKSGAAEIVQDGKTGILFDEQSISALAQAIQKCEKQVWNTQLIRDHVQKYDTQHFQKEFAAGVARAWKKYQIEK